MLSVLHTHWPGDLPALVPRLDAWGYRRFWTTEHHGPRQSASPLVAAAVAAGLSTRMRVGTAGVMAHVHAPLAVAQAARLLELLYPGRVDLGLIGGAPSGPALAAALDGRPAPTPARYAERVAEVVRLARHQGGGARALHGSRVGPVGAERAVPQLWLGGTSARSAALAGRLGLAYAFHPRIHAQRAAPADGPAVLAAYRDAFSPDGSADRPRTAVVVSGLCAPTEAAARDGWDAFVAARPPGADAGLLPNVLGTPARCAEQLRDVRRRYAAEELVVQTCALDLDARLESYELLAEAWGLSATPSIPRLAEPPAIAAA